MAPRTVSCRLLFAILLGMLCFGARAEIADLNSAINKAGRQRMLSQRLAKAYFQLGLAVEPERSRRILDTSVATFDRHLGELKGFAPTPEIKDTYLRLDRLWQQYRQALTGAVPTQAEGARILALSEEVLALAHRGVQQIESYAGTASSRLVNIAGRQRMLTQRMAKYYQARAWQIGVDQAAAEIEKARREFVAALDELLAAPINTPALRDELDLVRQQWIFFEHALVQPSAGGKRNLVTVATTSERIFEMMEHVVTLYEKQGR